MTMPGKPDWHWPSFAGPLCGNLSDRDRLGLPDHYVADRFGAAIASACGELRQLETDALSEMCEDPSVDLVRRLAAGFLLGLLGDPRIELDRPVMIAIPGGEIEIGLADAEVDAALARCAGLGIERRWLEKECPRHRRQLRPFAIAKYPVTHREYREFLMDTGYPALPSSWHCRRFPQEFSNHPVHTVSAAAADAYAAWLAARTGRGFRLPSEAEWEYAAAGPDGREFPWGDAFDADKANTAETGLFQSSPVGVFVDGLSPFGVADLGGNVEEYVADDYLPYPGGAEVADHLSAIAGRYRVARGGCFSRFRDLARTRRRHGHNPRSVLYAIGFRLAEDLE